MNLNGHVFHFTCLYLPKIKLAPYRFYKDCNFTKIAKLFIKSFEVQKKTHPRISKIVCTNVYPYPDLRKNELNPVALKLIIKLNLGHISLIVTSRTVFSFFPALSALFQY